MVPLLFLVLVASVEAILLHPCRFNPECLCSTGIDMYGSVYCDGVPLADIPLELQEEKVFKLHLRNNDLKRLPESKLLFTGMWKLEVSHNKLTSIPPMAFYGLERALWELHLNNNQLTRVPVDSISVLKKLYVLNLADNMISEVRREDLQSLSSTLKELNLSGNSFTSVSEGIFWDLQRLEHLDLSRNNIIQIHSMAFQNGVPMLAELYLSDNLMGKIPFVSIGHIKTLKKLDLSNNRIEKIEDPFFQSPGLQLDQLLLNENNIETLPSKAFVNFDIVNVTSLSGNPMVGIEANAFKDAKIRVLDMSNCFLSSISNGAFKGLERTLEELDISANRLKQLPEDLLDDFDVIKKLELNDNMLDLSPNITFNGFRYSLKELNLLGQDMSYVSLKELGLLRHLRRIGLADFQNKGKITRTLFEHFSPGIEELNLVNAGVVEIDSHAFSAIPSVSSMDLSNNKIDRISDDAFKEVGATLRHLKMNNALHLTKLPKAVFHSMTGMITLDLSNNHIRELPLDSFHKMSRLKFLYLQDNQIESFRRGTFHSQANPDLQILDLSFNMISEVPYDTFRFPKLKKLMLDDNKISKLEPRSFVEMTQLVYLSLEGNLISRLPEETFQNLHHLSTLNLAYNQLTQVEFSAFDSVGTLSHLAIDLSHNNLQALRVNRTSYPTTSNIMKLDLSCNNISMVEATFFEPVHNVLKVLNLSRNILTEITADTFQEMKRLYTLDLSFNSLASIEAGSFASSSFLQAIYLQGNRLTSLNPSLFVIHKRLRFVDLSWNFLDILPEQLFQRTSLEILRLSHNRLNEIPIKTLNPVQSSLKQLDLAGNRITTISDSQLSQIQSLVALDLADNYISTIDQRAFCCLPNLIWLSLASNPIQKLDTETFNGIKGHLETLNVANISLTLMPNFQFPNLKELNVSYNQLTFVPSNTLANLSEVRMLDLSHNELPAPPNSAWHSMNHLRVLSLAGNPIVKITNESFSGLEHLEELDICNIQSTSYQSGSFAMMMNLRHLKITIDGKVPQFNLATLLSDSVALESLTLHLVGDGLLGGRPGTPTAKGNPVDKGGGALRHELQDVLPLRLKRITIIGEDIKNIHPAAFKYLRSRRLELIIRATKIADIDRDLFLNLGRVQNLSLDVSRPVLTDDDLARQRSQGVPDPGLESNPMEASAMTLSKDEQEGGLTSLTIVKPVIVLPANSRLDGPPHRLGNPVTTYSPNHPRAVFLHDLRIGGSVWTCTCDGIGWVERWLRRWRSIFCGHSSQTSLASMPSDIEHSVGGSGWGDLCQTMVRDLRSASCGGESRANPPSVLNDLKSRLECDAFNGASLSSTGLSLTSTLVILITFLILAH